jgi:phosphohistidine phosphatase SixA
VRRSLLLALLLAAVAAAGGCDLESDGDDGSGERPRAAELRSDGVSASVVQRLRRGGYVLAFRHAATDLSTTDMTGDLRDCSRQRNLNSEGRRQARSIGRAFRRLGIPVGRVLASPFCRTRDTARLAFGRARSSRALLSGDFFADGDARQRQSAGLRRLLAAPPRPGTNTILVSHNFAIADATGLSLPRARP